MNALRSILTTALLIGSALPALADDSEAERQQSCVTAHSVLLQQRSREIGPRIFAQRPEIGAEIADNISAVACTSPDYRSLTWREKTPFVDCLARWILSYSDAALNQGWSPERMIEANRMAIISTCQGELPPALPVGSPLNPPPKEAGL